MQPTVVHVFAARRSGQHAVIQWLLASLGAAGIRAGHRNNVCEVPIGASTKNLAWPLNGSAPLDEEVIVVNYEDVAYRDRMGCNAYRGAVEAGVPGLDLIIVREICSLAASRLQRFKATGTLGTSQIGYVDWGDLEALWWDHVSSLQEVSTVNFGRWVRSPSYRENLCGALFSVSSAEVGLSFVSPKGGGSSFTGVDGTESPRFMRVLERWVDLDSDLVAQYAQFLASLSLATHIRNSSLFGVDISAVRTQLCDA